MGAENQAELGSVRSPASSAWNWVYMNLRTPTIQAPRFGVGVRGVRTREDIHPLGARVSRPVAGPSYSLYSDHVEEPAWGTTVGVGTTGAASNASKRAAPSLFAKLIAFPSWKAP